MKYLYQTETWLWMLFLIKIIRKNKNKWVVLINKLVKKYKLNYMRMINIYNNNFFNMNSIIALEVLVYKMKVFQEIY